MWRPYTCRQNGQVQADRHTNQRREPKASGGRRRGVGPRRKRKEGDTHMTLINKRVVLATVAAGAIALGVAAAGHVSAQNTNQNPRPFNGPFMGPGGRGGMLGPGGPLAMLRMLGPQLNLTDAQKAQIKSIADSHRDEWKSLGDRGRTAHDALNASIMAD